MHISATGRGSTGFVFDVSIQMAESGAPKRYLIDLDRLADGFPTNRHAPEFWESLGRVVATYGFLEEVLGKAIFSLTATRFYPPEEIEAAFEKWLPTLQRALSDPLGGLIDTYAKALRDHQDRSISNPDSLIEELRKAATMRNVLCHGSWRVPDDQGCSVPLFVNRQGQVFDGAIDVAFLIQVQKHAVELVCAVMNTVTHMGWQFPGSVGPGRPIT